MSLSSTTKIIKEKIPIKFSGEMSQVQCPLNAIGDSLISHSEAYQHGKVIIS